MVGENHQARVAQLRSEILRMQGFKPASDNSIQLGLPSVDSCFPNHTFPLGAIHEFLVSRPEDISASVGFISGLLSKLMGSKGTALWISTQRKVFPTALATFGLHPERFVFVDLQQEKDALWAIDEALKCDALTAVVGELHDLSFNESRKLQLAVEASKVTGFILRKARKNISTTASVTRWKITSLPSDPVDGLPGVGFPKWKVELLRVRNGKTGTWELSWRKGHFETREDTSLRIVKEQRKTG